MGMSAGQVPEGCDCCGHDAEDCGMLDAGWVSDAELISGGGVFCRECAHLLRIARRPEWCAWCNARMLEEDQGDSRGWAYFFDELGDLHPCCPGCLADRFGITRPARLRRAP